MLIIRKLPISVRITLICGWAFFPLALFGQAGLPSRPLTLQTALKLGVEGLIEKFTDPSESGQDEAARLYAVAKQLETGYALAKRDVALVMVLDEWRTVISQCRDGFPILEGIVMQGGTMYHHAVARDVAAVETFLAGLAQRLPLAEGKGDAQVTQAMEGALRTIRKLKMESDADPASMATLAREIESQEGNWLVLIAKLQTVPAAEAKRISAFVLEAMSWVQEEPGQ